MGSNNQLNYLKRLLPTLSGPVLEIGSKDYGNTSSFRDFYVTNEYIGIDLEPGKGVDKVGDLTQDCAGLPEDYFALAICCSVLEHTRKPWIMAENITKLVKTGSWLYIAVPWVWRYHPYPDDYFRFSHTGIKSLFPAFDWNDVYYATTVDGEYLEINDDSNGADNSMAIHIAVGAGFRKYLPYLEVNMLGIKTH